MINRQAWGLLGGTLDVYPVMDKGIGDREVEKGVGVEVTATYFTY